MEPSLGPSGISTLLHSFLSLNGLKIKESLWNKLFWIQCFKTDLVILLSIFLRNLFCWFNLWLLWNLQFISRKHPKHKGGKSTHPMVYCTLYRYTVCCTVYHTLSCQLLSLGNYYFSTIKFLFDSGHRTIRSFFGASEVNYFLIFFLFN